MNITSMSISYLYNKLSDDSTQMYVDVISNMQ